MEKTGHMVEDLTVFNITSLKDDSTIRRAILASQRRMGAALGYVNILAKNLVNLLYTPLLLHYLGQGDYGVFQMTNSVIFMLTLLSAGFYGAYVRFYTLEKTHGTDEGIRKLNGVFLLVYAAAGCLCLLIGLLLIINVDNLFSRGLSPSELQLTRDLMVVMSMNIVVTLLSTPFDSYIVVHERFAFQQTRQLLTSVATPFIAIGALALRLGAVGVAGAQLAVSVMLLLLNIRFSVGKLGMRFSFSHLEFGLFKSIAIFSFWIFLNQVFDLINNQVPDFLLGAMSGATVVATFSIAVQIRSLFFSLSTTMSSVFVPMINRIVATTNDNKALTELMTRVGRYQMILFCYIFGGFVILGQFFVLKWAGKANADSYWLALIMVLPVVIPLTQNTGIEIQRAKNKHKARSLIYILTAVIDIVISLIFIPSIGYWATAIGYIVSICLGTGLFMNWYYQCHIGLDMKYFWTQMLPTLGVSVIVTVFCLLLTRVLPVHSLMTFVLWGVVYSAIYLVLAWFLLLTDSDKERVRIRLHAD